MSEPKHTPGPWSINNHEDWSVGYDGAGNAAGRFILDAEGNVIGSAQMAHWGYETPAELDTNAALISAAPELLASVLRFLAHFDRTEMSDHNAFPGIAATISEAKVAVAKATTVFPW